MNFYIIELVIWLAVMMFLVFWFRAMARKTRNAADAQAKNVLFTLMLLIGLPLLLFEIIAPVIIIMGDNSMPVEYKYVFGAEILAVLVYFISTQRSTNKS